MFISWTRSCYTPITLILVPNLFLSCMSEVLSILPGSGYRDNKCRLPLKSPLTETENVFYFSFQFDSSRNWGFFGSIYFFGTIFNHSQSMTLNNNSWTTGKNHFFSLFTVDTSNLFFDEKSFIIIFGNIYGVCLIFGKKLKWIKAQKACTTLQNQYLSVTM